MLHRVHLAKPHLGRERLVLHHEGIGRRGAARPGLLEEIGQQIDHVLWTRSRTMNPSFSYTWVPPTVIPSILMVGSPTPTGTD